jgi:hypothetical protein
MSHVSIAGSRTFKGRSSQTLGQAGKGPVKRRQESLRNRKPPIVSAACQRNDHAQCFSLNCICDRCTHGAGWTKTV